MTGGNWPKQFTRARRLDAVVDRYTEAQTYRQPIGWVAACLQDVGFLIECLDGANRRIENLLSLLARERNRAERDSCTYCLAPRMKGAKTCARCAL